MNIKLQIKNRFTGSLLFEYESEKNTIKETLLQAIKAKADLRGADLRGAYLSYADLRGADLRGAYLSYADLSGAYLSGADLRGAYLSYADLSGADLRGAYLRGADIRGADLRGADLSYADLSYADLSYADLRGADLSGADLRGADLRGADIRGADLRGAKDVPAIAIAQTRVCAEGDIFGYKKCLNGVIIKLLIPKEAKRNNAFGRKCRAEYAKVIEIIGADEAISQHDNTFTYKVGDIVRPTTPFDEDFTNECSTGIHFFITSEEAKNY